MALSEKEYNDLYKYSLNIAGKYVGYKDCAYDIAQNTMLSFISSKAEIHSPYSWIRITVRREAAKFVTNEKKETQTIPQKAKIELKSAAGHEEDSDDILRLSVQKIKQILNPQDFEIYRKLKAQGFSPTKYAEQEKLLLTTVKTHKKRIKKNLESAYLLMEGWRSSQKILNYCQYCSINRFINQVMDSVHNNKLADLKNYLQRVKNEEIYELFKDVESCKEWYVVYSDNTYKLFLVCTPFNPFPKVIELTISFNKKNYISVVMAAEKKPYFVANNNADALQKYKSKGTINLSSEQLASILSDKQTDV
jgi:DNA-directed RNA polymerase specialized sigma24 family protein